jgi:glycosyltransferase involved in cell wall biosynthesis
MRLLLVSHCPNDPNAGASRVYHFLTDGLRRRGHEVQCLHLEDIEIPRAIWKLAYRCFLPHFVSGTAARVLKQSTAPFDVVFCSSGMLWPLFKRLQSMPTRPTLVHDLLGLSFFNHQSTMDETARGQMTVSVTYRFLTGALPPRWDIKGVQHSDLTIVQNRRDEDFLLAKNFQHVKWIPLAVHPEILTAGESAPNQGDRDPMSLLWFGSWIVRKGTHYLPRAFERICERFADARLTIGGTGASQRDIASHFKESLREKIRVLPRVSVKEQIAELGTNAIFLFPSLSEGFGFAGLEALAMGAAVVTTQTGFGGDFLVDRYHARVVPAASALHMADAVIELMENQDLREHIAENGKKLAQELTTERMVNEYEAEIKRVLNLRERVRTTTEPTLESQAHAE